MDATSLPTSSQNVNHAETEVSNSDLETMSDHAPLLPVIPSTSPIFSNIQREWQISGLITQLENAVDVAETERMLRSSLK
jgi:hypothetical protein